MNSSVWLDYADGHGATSKSGSGKGNANGACYQVGRLFHGFGNGTASEWENSDDYIISGSGSGTAHGFGFLHCAGGNDDDI